MTSSDGANWSSHSTGLGTINFSSLAYGNGVIVAIADNGHIGNFILTSSDGSSWSAHDVGAYGNDFNILNGVGFGGGQFVAVSTVLSGDMSLTALGGFLYTSTDGVTWTRQAPYSASSLNAVAFGNAQFVAVGSSGAIMVSP